MEVYVVFSYWDPDVITETSLEGIYMSHELAKAHIEDLEKGLKEEYKDVRKIDYICSRIFKEEVIGDEKDSEVISNEASVSD